MFFEEDILADILTCPKCKKKFIDPRLMGCGETICNKCITISTNDQNIKGCECDFCNFFHQLFPPMDSFPPNKPIQKLIDQENLKISQSHLINQFKALLDSLKDSCEELSLEKVSATKTVKNFCTRTRNEVQVASKLVMADIQKQTEEIMARVNKYESQCLLNCANLGQNDKIDSIHILSESESFQSKWTDYINFQVVKEADIRQALEKAKLLLKSMDTKTNFFKQSLFEDKLAYFRPECIENISIGTLLFEKISECFLKLEQFQQIDLKNILYSIDPMFYDCVYVHNFADDSYLFAYPVGPFNIKLSIFKEDKLLREYELVQPINQFKKAIYQDTIFLFFSFCKKLRSLNKEFAFQDESAIESEVVSMAATNKFVFCLIEGDMILKFNHKLSLVQKIKINEENLNELAQYLSRYNQLKSFKDAIFLTGSYGMISINSMNLKEFKKLPIKEKKFVFYDQKIVTVNDECDRVIFYDFGGMVIHKQELPHGFGKHLILIESQNYDNLSFFDFSNYILYKTLSS